MCIGDSLELSREQDDGRRGHCVLVTRLSAIQDSASMDVLCTDKTGTLTLNQLSLEDVVAYRPYEPATVLDLAAAASDDAQAGAQLVPRRVLREREVPGRHRGRGAQRAERRRRGPGAKPCWRLNAARWCGSTWSTSTPRT